jgi:hypothetical protein
LTTNLSGRRSVALADGSHTPPDAMVINVAVVVAAGDLTRLKSLEIVSIQGGNRPPRAYASSEVFFLLTQSPSSQLSVLHSITLPAARAANT